MRDEVFKSLENRWHELYDQYEAIREPALSQVVRWEWANRPRYDPRPFHFLINPPRGRVLKQPPQDDRQKVNEYEYGFDTEGRVCVHRYYVYSNHWETFYSYTPHQIEITTFGKYQGRHLMNELAIAAMQEGRMQHYANLRLTYSYIDPSLPYPAPMQVERYQGKGLEGITANEAWEQLSQKERAIEWSWQEYRYKGKRLETDLLYYRASRGEPSETLDRFEYDSRGQLQRIVWVRGENQRLLYHKRQPGENLATLSDRAKRKLIEAIPQAVAAAQFDEPLYCLNLYYFRAKSGQYFPPEVFVGLERQRQHKIQVLKEVYLAAHVWWYLWSSGDHDDVYYDPLPITDVETLEACELLNVELNMAYRGWYAAKILRQLARELNKLDWSQYAPVTPDFIVYACDQTEHEEIAASLRYSGATKAQLADWRKRGLL